MDMKSQVSQEKNDEVEEIFITEVVEVNMDEDELAESELLQEKVAEMNEKQINTGVKMLKVEIPERIASINNFISVWCLIFLLNSRRIPGSKRLFRK